MAKLTSIEKDKLEILLNMSSGYVLDFTDAKFTDFFHDLNINIDDSKYTKTKPSRSKANRLRGFWEQESDSSVGKVLEKLIDFFIYLKGKNGTYAENNEQLILDCKNIANRLTGKQSTTDTQTSETDFLAINFSDIDFLKLPVDHQVVPILKNRLSEAHICIKNGANLASIFMTGSILEGALLGAAIKHPSLFNKSNCCPKDKTGKSKEFQEWTLSELINVGNDVGLLGKDVKEFSHALRNFRNYIHPYNQISDQFKPDKNTAKICLQVLKAAFFHLTENKTND